MAAIILGSGLYGSARSFEASDVYAMWQLVMVTCHLVLWYSFNFQLYTKVIIYTLN